MIWKLEGETAAAVGKGSTLKTLSLILHDDYYMICRLMEEGTVPVVAGK